MDRAAQDAIDLPYAYPDDDRPGPIARRLARALITDHPDTPAATLTDEFAEFVPEMTDEQKRRLTRNIERLRTDT